MSTQNKVQCAFKATKGGKIRLLDGFDIATKRIIEKQCKYAMYISLFGNGINYHDNYDFDNFPITSEAIKKKCDVGLLVNALMSLESKGNETAREILFDRFRDFETGISFDDLLQELRLAIIECEIDGLITIGYAETFIDCENGYCEDYSKPRIVAIDETAQSEVIKRLYGSISRYLYQFRQHEKKHLSVEIDGDIIDIMDRKNLANYVDTNKVIESDFINQFKTFVYNESNKTSRTNRLHIIDGLIKGWTYRQIADYYNLGISTIGDNVKAI